MGLRSSALTNRSCPDIIQVDRGTAGENVDTEITVVDNNGCSADLSEVAGYEEPPEDPIDPTDPTSPYYNPIYDPNAPEYDPSAVFTPPERDLTQLPRGMSAVYTAKPSYNSDAHRIVVDLTAIDASKGRFRLKFMRPDLSPGIYLAEVGIVNSSGGLYLRDRRFLELLPTLRYVNHGPITEQEVRLRMRDFGCLNTLTKQEESSPAEIMNAIRGAVDLWNAEPPLGVAVFDTACWPHNLRGGWMEGVICILLDSHGIWRRRNSMTIQNSTISIKDNDNWQSYLQDSVMRRERWLQWVRMAKRSINMGMGFGHLASPYARIY